MADPKLTIKNYRSAGHGMEGEMWSCTLYVDGKRAALVSDSGNGAELNIDWSPSGGFRFRPGPVGEKVLAYVKGLPPLPPTPDYPRELPMDLDLLIQQMVDDMLEEKKLKQWCKKSMVLRDPDAPEGQYLRYKTAYNPTLAEHARRHFAAKGVNIEVINERFAT